MPVCLVVAVAVAVSGCTASGHNPAAPATAASTAGAAAADAPGISPSGASPSGASPSGASSAGGSSSGPASPGATGQRPPTPAQLPRIDPATLAKFYRQKISWTACGDSLQCGELSVPLDYENPAGPAISLALIRHRTGSRNRIGSAVLNPGGPGGSGVDFLRSAWHAYDQLLQSRFDVVSFDPRGVGASDPIRCVPSTLEDQYVSYDVDPTNPAEVAHQKQLNDEFASGCGKMSAQLLPHVGTPETARDLDVLRAALGDDKLTYIGESYGTFLGAIYAELFPTKIRALVLDGVVDPTLDDVAEAAGQAAGFEIELRAFIANCARHGGCALGSSSSAAESKLDGWLDTLVTAPLKGGGRELTKMLAISGIAAALYTPQSWDSLNSALGKAMRGDPSAMFVLADELTGRRADGSYSNELEANVAINCADRGTSLPSIDAAAKAALAGQKNGPTFGELLGWADSTCIDWPAPGELSPGPVHAAGAPPIVVVGNTRDPATPLAWAQSLAGQLDSGVLVTWDGDGHTADLRSTCVDGLVRAYVVSLKAPAKGTLCPASG